MFEWMYLKCLLEYEKTSKHKKKNLLLYSNLSNLLPFTFLSNDML